MKYKDTGCEFSLSTEELQFEARRELKKLFLAVKQGFQLLNTTGFSLQDKEMLSIWQGLQVYRAVIILNAVQVMNYPTLWKAFVVEEFPIEEMLRDISLVVSPGVVRFMNSDITTIILKFSTFPVLMIFSLLEKSCEEFSRSPSVFHQAVSATLRFWLDNFPTINAPIWRLLFSKQLPHLGSCAFYAPSSVPRTGLPTINTGMFMGLLPFLFTIHNNIITNHHLNVNLLISQMQGGCLNCPFKECIKDYPGGKKAFNKAERNLEIRRLWREGKSPKELAPQFNLTLRTIQRIVSG